MIISNESMDFDDPQLFDDPQPKYASKNAKYAKYAYLGAYLVKWGVPEKILQNAVQTRWS